MFQINFRSYITRLVTFEWGEQVISKYSPDQIVVTHWMTCDGTLIGLAISLCTGTLWLALADGSVTMETAMSPVLNSKVLTLQEESVPFVVYSGNWYKRTKKWPSWVNNIDANFDTGLFIFNTLHAELFWRNINAYRCFTSCQASKIFLS